MTTEYLGVKVLLAAFVAVAWVGSGCAGENKSNTESSGSTTVSAAGSGTAKSAGTGATSGTAGEPESGMMATAAPARVPAVTPRTTQSGSNMAGATAVPAMPASMGGSPSAGASAAAGAPAAMGGAGMGAAGAAAMDATKPTAGSGMCTASESTGKMVSGTGPHQVVIETNAAEGIRCGTIFRPADLGKEMYPIFVWGEGGCSQNGLSNQAAMGEIASWGYFIVADGTPASSGRCQGGQSGAAFLDYITWAIAENDKPCSAYYQSLNTKKIAADGFSCGGLMSENVAGDPRFTAIGITSSGLMGANAKLWDSMHAPFKVMNGGSSDIAYENGLNDYEAISSRGIPTLYFSKKSAGHGGDLGQARGDFNMVNLAFLNWQLKGDEGATGKGFLFGPSCKFCMDSGWDYKSANIQ